MPVLLGQKSGQRTGITSGERSASAPTPKVRYVPNLIFLKKME